jgi:sugar transferase (PEP-CTERM system associated)
MSTGTAMLLLDVAGMALAWPLALWLAGTGGGLAAALYPAANLVLLYALGLYRRDATLSTRTSLARLPLAVGLGVTTAAAAGWLAARLLGTPPPAAGLFVAASVGFAAAGVAARAAFSALKHAGLLRRRLLVLGAGARAWDLALLLRREGRTLAYDVSFLHDPALGALDARLAREAAGRIVNAPAGQVWEVAQRVRADQIVVAPDDRRGMPMAPLLACKTAGLPVAQYLGFVETEIRRIDLKRMELGWLLYSGGFYFGTIDEALKRALDIAVSAVLLLAFAPFLAAAALAIKCQDGGPVLYRQQRVTRHGRTFDILKLRSMRVDAEPAGAVWAAAADSRITRVGALLRRTRIDEMPQLFNVLHGEMSLVGPRPERPGFVAQLSAEIPLYGQRHIVKAGLTGWAQVNYPYGASTDDARSKLSYDLYYVKNFSLLFDLLILLQTLRVVLWPGGVR